MNIRLVRTALACVATGLLMSACGGGDDDLADRTNTADPQLRLIHASAASPAVTLYRNGSVDDGGSNISYKGYSSYHGTTFGTNTLVLRPAASSTTDLSTATIDAQRGRKYTAVAVPDNTVGAQLLVIDDPFEKPVGNDQARVRWVNASSNANAVDVYVTAPNADIASAAPNFSSVQFRTAVPASGNNAVQFTDGTYQVRVTTAGTKTVIFNNTVALAKNDDVVMITAPSDAVGLAANDIRVLVVKADDTSHNATELANQ